MCCNCPYTIDEGMITWFKHAKVQLYVCSGCKLEANVMTSDHTAAENLKLHTKQHLNEFNSVDNIIKMVTNYNKEMIR